MNEYLSPAGPTGLWWGGLTEGRLIKRYKRFLADVELDGGRLITAHTANTGRMTGCQEPGRRVFLSFHDDPKRKYKYGLEMIEMPEALVGVNTLVPNRLVAHCLENGMVPEIGRGLEVHREVRHGQSRLDIFLKGRPGQKDVFIEVKNCTLAEGGQAYFPDAVTERGRKHLEELAALAKEGARAVIFILVQRADGKIFSPADHIDPDWGRALREALGRGVELLAYQALLDLKSVRLGPRLPVLL